MALYKPIELDSGVIVNYHRIVSLNIVTNIQNIVEISSYTTEKKRQEEQTAIENGETSNVFVHTSIMGIPYDQSATIETTYEYLKTLSIFESAKDI